MPLRKVRWVERSAYGVGECQLITYHWETRCKLTLPVAYQGVRCFLGQRNAAAATPRFRAFESLLTVTRNQGALYMHDATLQLYVGPVESGKLPPTCPAGNPQHEQRREPVVFCRRQEPPSFLKAQGSNLRLRDHRRGYFLAHVLLDVPPPHGRVERGG